ncbi:MAG TPA: hypothetical protein VFM11_05995 [Burkholderiales bacterium]|nr:hypothetical protein [Burkholderiales bacterium]
MFNRNPVSCFVAVERGSRTLISHDDIVEHSIGHFHRAVPDFGERLAVTVVEDGAAHD